MTFLHSISAAMAAALVAIGSAVEPPREIPPPPLPANRSDIAGDAPVDVALVLAVDVSSSMNDQEQKVQRAGYVEALSSPEFFKAIRDNGAYGRIALTYIEWGGVGEQFIVIDWRVIATRDDALQFAKDLAAAPTKSSQRTSISSALAFSVGRFVHLYVPADRRVIDVSGDGVNNHGEAVVTARNRVIAAGVTINGLPIMLKEGASWYYEQNLDHYYEDCVIGGHGAFVVTVESLGGFAEAIRRKLVLEVADVRDSRVTKVVTRPPANC
jgi:hypothetical protein